MQRSNEVSVRRKSGETPVEADSGAEEMTIPDYVMLDFGDGIVLISEKRGVERVTESGSWYDLRG